MKLIKISKLYHVIILFTFFLPFYSFEFCGPSAEELKKAAMADSLKKADSIQKTDSVKQLLSLHINNSLNTKTNRLKDSSINIKKEISEIDKSKIHRQAQISNIKSDSIHNNDTFKTNKSNDLNNNLLKDTIDRIKANKNDNNKSNIENNGFFPKMKEFLLTVLLYMMFGGGGLSGFGKVLDFVNFLHEFGVINSYLLILLSCLMIFIKRWRFIKSILLIDIFGFLFLLGTSGELWGYWVCLYSWIGLIILDAVLISKQKRSSPII
jgi:hypothetical protein